MKIGHLSGVVEAEQSEAPHYRVKDFAPDAD